MKLFIIALVIIFVIIAWRFGLMFERWARGLFE